MATKMEVEAMKVRWAATGFVLLIMVAIACVAQLLFAGRSGQIALISGLVGVFFGAILAMVISRNPS